MSQPDMLRVTLDNGKYTIVQDASGRTMVLRHGDEWRDVTGDNVILAAGYEIDRLRAGGCARDQRSTQFCAEAATLIARVETLEAQIRQDSAELEALDSALAAEEKTKDPIRWAHPDTARRVAYLNALRSVVSRRCPVNKMGAPLVTDFDLLAASKEEIAEAFEIAKGKTP